MEALDNDLRAILCMHERGGRIRHIGPNEILVLDITEFNEHTHAVLLERHPTLHTSAEACPESLSGFAIRMQLQPDSTRPLLLAMACVAVLVAVCMHCMDFV